MLRTEKAIYLSGGISMKTKVAINGFGRIGRMAFRIISDRSDLEVVGINAKFPSLPGR